MFLACFKDMRSDSCMSDSLSFVTKSNLCFILSSSSSKISDNHFGLQWGWKNHQLGIRTCTICDGVGCVLMDTHKPHTYIVNILTAQPNFSHLLNFFIFCHTVTLNLFISSYKHVKNELCLYFYPPSISTVTQALQSIHFICRGSKYNTYMNIPFTKLASEVKLQVKIGK